MKFIVSIFLLLSSAICNAQEVRNHRSLERLFGEASAGTSAENETQAENQAEPQTEAECTSCLERLFRDPYADIRQVSEAVTREYGSDMEPMQARSAGIQGRSFTRDSWSDVPLVANYSESPQVRKMIQTAVNRKRTMPRYVRLKGKLVKVKGKLVRKKGRLVRAEGQCYKYVKNALLGSKLVNFRPPGEFAHQGVRDLKAQGFINLLDRPQYRSRIDSPGSAPKGALLVYAKENGAGHIEIKTDHGTSGGYVGEYWNDHSILQDELSGMAARRYQLIGVMIKPAEDEE